MERDGEGAGRRDDPTLCPSNSSCRSGSQEPGDRSRGTLRGLLLAPMAATGPCLAGLVCTCFSQARVEILVLSGTLPLGKLSPDDGGVAHSPISLSSAKSPQCLPTAHPLFPGMLSAVKAAGLSLRGRGRRGPGAPWPRLPVFFPGPGWLSCLLGQRRINQGYALHPRWCRGHVSHCSAFMAQAKHIILVVL